MDICEIIQREIEEYRANPYEQDNLRNNPDWQVKSKYLNNFYGHFTPEENEKVFNLKRLARQFYWNIPYKQFLEERMRRNIENGRQEPEAAKRDLALSLEEKSGLYLSQTGAEFYDTIDNTVAEVGVVPAELQKLATHTPRLRGEVGQIFIEKMLFPIYVRLREKGYRRDDLIG